MTVDVDRNLSFERTHAIAEAVESRVQSVAPGADVVIHTDPREVERETMAKRIRAMAYRNQMSVHNISMHEDRDQVYVDLHLEVDDHLSLQQAHDMATHIEKDLKEDMPNIARITTHLESRGTGMGDGVDVTAEEPDLVGRSNGSRTRSPGPPRCHNVMIRRTGIGCLGFAPLPFRETALDHPSPDISTRIEERLKDRIPGLDRVLVHAEPDDR